MKIFFLTKSFLFSAFHLSQTIVSALQDWRRMEQKFCEQYLILFLFFLCFSLEICNNITIFVAWLDFRLRQVGNFPSSSFSKSWNHVHRNHSSKFISFFPKVIFSMPQRRELEKEPGKLLAIPFLIGINTRCGVGNFSYLWNS